MTRTTAPSRRALLAGALAAPLLATPALLTASAARADHGGVHVLTAHPAAFALASALAEGTGISIRAVQPAKLPPSRLASYLGGRGAAELADATTDADAVLTFRSFWPQDPLFAHARRSRIRIVEIDAGRPLDEELPGIALYEPTSDAAIYQAMDLDPMVAIGVEQAPWLSPATLNQMLAITAADFSRLDIPSIGRIAANRESLSTRLRDIRTRADLALAEASDLSCLTLDPAASYLAADLGLDLMGEIIAAPREWTPDRVQRLQSWLSDNGTQVVLHGGAPDEVQTALQSAGVRLVELVEIPADATDPVPTLAENLDRLTRVFAPNSAK